LDLNQRQVAKNRSDLLYLHTNIRCMKKFGVSFMFFWLTFFSFAEEGMLIPSLLEAFESDMKAMGMTISIQDIYDVNNASIKDAIFHFGGGCTSSVISEQGLLITNHHCGYSQIYSHTTVENNIANNGFWAKNYSEELPNPGLTATRMVRIEDITAKVLEGTEGLSDAKANQQIQVNIARIKAESIKGTHYQSDIKPFNFGNSYFLLVKEVFNDVRLVGTPPKSIGKFGGDTDNWVWPRHTGDFAVFRIYADQNNQPAEYNESNKPYSPLYHLPISIKPRKKGDFTLVFGFPGVTEQHTISTELEDIINKIRPAQIEMRDLSLSVINEAMRKSLETEINYATKQSRIANAWKKWIGQIDGLKRGNAVEKKITEENAYTAKAQTKPEWKEEYGNVVQELRNIATQFSKEEFAYNMFIEYIYVGSEIFNRARKIDDLLKLYNVNPDGEDLKNELNNELKSLDGFYEKYNPEIDKSVFLLQTKYYTDILDDEYLPKSLKTDLTKLANVVYKESFLVDKDKYKKVIRNFNKFAKKKIGKDPGYRIYSESLGILLKQVIPNLREYYGHKDYLMKTYVKGKLEMYPDKKHWADANSTLRVSYGMLEGSSPHDGMKYTEHTTLSGVIDKYNTGKEDFELLPRMLELYEEKNYGEYAQNGELWINFTSSNHTTGGNSGSPVINGEGHLVGVNFDRTWESTMSDYMFDSSRCRNISVDIRYVLWLIDIYGEADHIIKELTLIKQ